MEAFDDPKVKGVTLYVSNFERPLTERIQKDFFTEPSYASVTCVRNGKEIDVANNIHKSSSGEVSCAVFCGYVHAKLHQEWYLYLISCLLPSLSL